MSGAVTALYDLLKFRDPEGQTLIRAIRNTQHGPYLKGDQFESVFFSDFKIPPEVIYLPILLMWGLMLDYELFLDISRLHR